MLYADFSEAILSVIFGLNTAATGGIYVNVRFFVNLRIYAQTLARQ